MKYLYKYPQREFPYGDLVATNRRRSKQELEYELLDTGAFDDDRYFDVFRRVREGGTGGHPDPRSRSTTAAGRGAAAPPPDVVVPQHLVVGRRGREALAPREAGTVVASHPELGRVHALVRRKARAAVHRERDERREALGPAEPDAVREGRLPSLRGRQGAGRGQSREDRARRRRHTTSSRCPAGGVEFVQLRLTKGTAAGSVRGAVRGDASPAAADADEFYDADHAPARSARTSAACTGRRSRGCSGRSSTTTSTSTAG